MKPGLPVKDSPAGPWVDRIAALLFIVTAVTMVVLLAGLAGVGDLADVDVFHLGCGLRTAVARAAVDEVRLLRVELGDPIGEVRAVHVDVERADDMGLVELGRRPEALHGEVVAARLEVLAEGEHIHVVGAQVIHGLKDLVVRFAEAKHEAGLVDYSDMIAPGWPTSAKLAASPSSSENAYQSTDDASGAVVVSSVA